MTKYIIFLAMLMTANLSKASQYVIGEGFAPVNVFGYTLFDFRQGVAYSPLFRSDLKDCSNNETFCLESEQVAFTISRSCSQISEQLKTKSIGSLRIVGDYQSSLSHMAPPTRIYLLSSKRMSHAILHYVRDDGIIGITFDPRLTADFTNEVNVAQFRAEASRFHPTSGEQRRITLDPVALCDRP